MSLTAVGLVGIAVLLILVFARMPVGFAMCLVGFLGFAYIHSFNTSMLNLGLLPYSVVASFKFVVIPLFTLMSMVAAQAGLGQDIYKAAYSWLGHMRGGLAMATVVGCGGFAAICGDSMATAAVMGKVAVPEMERYKYDPRLSTGCIAAGGTLGILIPPSVGFILYGILTEQSIGRLFMAGLIPGILEAIFYMVVIFILCQRNPKMGPARPKTTFKHKVVSSKDAWPILALFVLVMGGIYLGVFTPSEAGALGAFGAFVIGFSLRRLSRQSIVSSFLDTGRITAMILLLIVGSMIFSRFIAISRIPFALANYMAGLEVNTYLILAGILIFYIILGCFLSVMSALVLTLPIIFPVILALGFDPIWYGVLMVRVMEVGMITPPIGINCFVISGMTKIPISTIYRGVIPFLVADILHIALLVFVPQISLFLPNMMKG